MQHKVTLRTYLLGSALLTLLTAALRTLSLTLAFDPASGYFEGGALPVIYRTVTLLSLAVIIALPLFFFKGKLSAKRTPLTRSGACGACLCALLFFINFIVGCTIKSTVLSPLLWLVGLISLLLATVYFILQTPFVQAGKNAHAVLGSITVLALACLIAFTYFDVSTPMNAPHKMDLHVALLSVILYLLYELRAKAEIARPLALLIFSSLSFFLSASIGVSDTVAYLSGTFSSPLYLAEDLLLLALAVYIGARSASDAALFKNQDRKEPAL